MTGAMVRESLHFDRPVSPLFATLFVPAVQEGYARVAARFGVPALTIRVVDHHVYTGLDDGAVSPPTEPPRMLAERVDAWERHALPEVHRLLDEIRGFGGPAATARRLAGELARLPETLARLYEIHYEAALATNDGLATLTAALARRGDAQAELSAATLLAPCPSLLRDVEEWLAEHHEADLAAITASPFWAQVRDRPAWLDLAAPTWGEEPERALRAARAADPARLREGTARATRLRDEAEAAMLARFPPEAHAGVRSGLAALRRAKGVAQSINFLVGEQALGAARGALRRAGERLGVGADVAYLEREELLAALRGEGPLPPRSIDERRFSMAARAREPPRERIGGEAIGDAKLTALLGARPEPRDDLRGLAASAGVVEGVARVCLTEDEVELLEKGEVLVVRSLPPSWTSASSRAAAIVAELGGMLCHAAIVARELGVPAVVGVGGATTRLATGARVRVDGATGEVELA